MREDIKEKYVIKEFGEILNNNKKLIFLIQILI